MAVLVIAGSGRGAGKTAVGCALIAAMPELRWVAVKVTPHAHDLADGLLEETDRNSEKDSARYLAAGAGHAFLIVREMDGGLLEWIRQARKQEPAGGAMLVESNAVAPWEVALSGEPAISLVVLAGPKAEWKPSVWNRIASAEALVLTGGLSLESLQPEFADRLCFELPDGSWLTPELCEFVRGELLD